MLALRLEFLTGRYVATAYDDRNAPEWPPHPARVYSALVATHHASEDPPPDERDALEWLAALDAPRLHASDASRRDVVPVFVPVNDVAVSARLDDDFADLQEAELALERARGAVEAVTGAARKTAERDAAKAQKARDKQRAAFESARQKAIQPGKVNAALLIEAARVLPEQRPRQPRTFPAVTPHDPVCWLVWPDAEPTDAQRAALDALCARLTRLGHSSSLVAARLHDTPPEPNWVPDDAGRELLRTTAADQLRLLEDEFVRHREEQPRVLPSIPRRYRGPSESAPRDTPRGVLGDDWIVFERVGGQALPVRRTPDVTAALRGTLLRRLQGQPDTLTGHDAARRPAARPHIAFLALPFVGRLEADGVILGVALALPRDLAPADRDALHAAIAACEAEARERDDTPAHELPTLKLVMGRTGELRIRRVRGLAARHTLKPSTWCGRSARWATVTPLALDRNPGRLYPRRHLPASDPAAIARERREADEALRAAEEIVAGACEHAGFPRPLSVCVTPVSLVPAAEPARAYGPFPAGPGKLRRVLVHAEVVFPEPVFGPVILGAGRHAGLGLCRPVRLDGDPA